MTTNDFTQMSYEEIDSFYKDKNNKWDNDVNPIGILEQLRNLKVAYGRIDSLEKSLEKYYSSGFTWEPVRYYFFDGPVANLNSNEEIGYVERTRDGFKIADPNDFRIPVILQHIEAAELSKKYTH